MTAPFGCVGIKTTGLHADVAVSENIRAHPSAHARAVAQARACACAGVETQGEQLRARRLAGRAEVSGTELA